MWDLHKEAVAYHSQSVSEFTIDCQRQSELIPGHQKDFDAFLIPGSEWNCTREAQPDVNMICNMFKETFSNYNVFLPIRSFHMLKIFHCFQNDQLLPVSKLAQLFPWQTDLKTLCRQLFYFDISEKVAIRKCMEDIARKSWEPAVPAFWVWRNAAMVPQVSSVMFWNFLTRSLWSVRMSGRLFTNRSSTSWYNYLKPE